MVKRSQDVSIDSIFGPNQDDYSDMGVNPNVSSMVRDTQVNNNQLRIPNHSTNERSYVLNFVNVFDILISSADITDLKLKET